MLCPRCGADSDEGSRYCAACGTELPKQVEPSSEKPAELPGFRERFERLVGSSRQARLLTIGTLAAIVIAIAAFVALRPSSEDEGAPQDAYTKALDASCVQHKRAIATAQGKALAGGDLPAVSRYADSLVAIVGEWRMELSNLAAPADRAERVGKLKSALLEVEIEAGTLSRVARESNRRGVATTAPRVDVATENVEGEIGSLGLDRCARLSVAQGRLARQ